MINRKERMRSNGQFCNINLEIIASLKNKSGPKAKVMGGGGELAEILLCLCLFLDQEKDRKQKS